MYRRLFLLDRRVTTHLLGAVVLTVLLAEAQGADWPHFLGPEYNVTSSESGLLKSWPKEGPRLVWQRQKGAGHTPPVVAGNRVVLFQAVDSREVIECLDARTGKPEWSVPYDAPYTPQYGAGPGPRTSPVIADGRVFTLGINAVLHCVDLQNGKVLWRRDLASDYNLLPTFFGHGGTPLVTGKRIIVSLGTTDQKTLIAFDVEHGRELWSAKHPWGGSYSSPIAATFHGRNCVLAFQGGMDDPPTGGLLCIDTDSGTVLSATPHRAKMFASVSISSPVVVENRVFVSEAYTEGGLCVEILPDYQARALWRAPKFDTYLGTAVHDGGYLYGFAGAQPRLAELVCYELSTGRELWRNELGGLFQRGSLLKADGAFLVLGENGDLGWLNLSPAGPKILAQAKLFDAPETWTPPVLSNGRVFVCQNESGAQQTKPRLLCYDLRPE